MIRPIFITRYFFNQLKQIKKKFPHLKNDLIAALQTFDESRKIHVGHLIYKIRIKRTRIN